MSESVVLVTGTSSGIGLATAVHAAQRGFRVVATMRDTERAGRLRAASEAAGVEPDIHALDVTDPDSIEACFAYLRSTYGRLDAVVNNAGAGHLGSIEVESLAAVRSVMEVNFFGVVAVTKAALPLLREAGGRLITVSSVGGVVGQPFNEAYCAAKFAVEGFMESLAPVASALGVRVTVVEPGAVSTEFVSNVQAQEPLPVQGTPYAGLLDAYLARTAAAFDPAAAQTADGVAEAIVAALADPDPAARIQTSDAARQFAGIKLSDLDGSHVQNVTRHWIAGA